MNFAIKGAIELTRERIVFCRIWGSRTYVCNNESNSSRIRRMSPFETPSSGNRVLITSVESVRAAKSILKRVSDSSSSIAASTRSCTRRSSSSLTRNPAMELTIIITVEDMPISPNRCRRRYSRRLSSALAAASSTIRDWSCISGFCNSRGTTPPPGSVGFGSFTSTSKGTVVCLVNFYPTCKEWITINHRWRSGSMGVKPGSVQQSLDTERRDGDQALRAKGRSTSNRFP